MVLSVLDRKRGRAGFRSGEFDPLAPVTVMIGCSVRRIPKNPTKLSSSIKQLRLGMELPLTSLLAAVRLLAVVLKLTADPFLGLADMVVLAKDRQAFSTSWSVSASVRSDLESSLDSTKHLKLLLKLRLPLPRISAASDSLSSEPVSEDVEFLSPLEFVEVDADPDENCLDDALLSL